MSISQEVIEAAKIIHRVDLVGSRFAAESRDKLVQFAIEVIREAGELLELPPPEVRVPDCFHNSQWISINGEGIISLHPTKPEYFEDQDVWHDDTGIALYILDGESLQLPDEFAEDSSWEVSELRKMANEHAKWEANQELSETLPEGWIKHTGDERPVAGDVEVYYRLAEETEFDETIIDVAGNLIWSQNGSGGIITHYKLVNQEPSQMEKDHEAMNRLRNGTIVVGFGGNWKASCGGKTSGIYTDPADAILAAGGE